MPILANIRAAHVFKATTVKFSVRMQTWDSLPTPNFAKIAEGHSPVLGKFIPKVANFAILWAMIPHSLGHKSEISVRVRT